MFHTPQQQSIQEELEEQAPCLASMDRVSEKREKLPSGYFELMQQQVLQKCRTLSASQESVKSIQRQIQVETWWSALLRPHFAIAATVCFAILGWFILAHPSQSTTESAFAQLDPKDAHTYLMAHAEELDESILQPVAEENTILTLEKNQIKEYLEENVAPEELEEI